jgi:AF2212-like
MSISTIEGIVENGQIRLLGNVTLPEHAKVLVVIPEAEPAPTARILSPRLVHGEQVGDFAKQVFEAPADAQL